MAGLITAAFIVAGATASSAYEAKKGRKDAKKARAVEAKSDKLKAARSAVDGIKAAQIARASILQQGENQGASGRSAVTGATGAVQSQAGGNIAFANTIFGLQNSARRLRESAGSLRNISSGISKLTNFGVSVSGIDFDTGTETT